jgi:prolyl-tRNA synthetase
VIPAGRDLVEPAVALATRLAAQGKRVLVDDRPGASPGVKFTDAELIGIPQTIVLGRRFSEGYVETRNRQTGVREEVRLAV